MVRLSAATKGQQPPKSQSEWDQVDLSNCYLQRDIHRRTKHNYNMCWEAFLVYFAPGFLPVQINKAELPSCVGLEKNLATFFSLMPNLWFKKNQSTIFVVRYGPISLLLHVLYYTSWKFQASLALSNSRRCFFFGETKLQIILQHINAR